MRINHRPMSSLMLCSTLYYAVSEYDNDFGDNDHYYSIEPEDIFLMVIMSWCLYKTKSLTTIGYET